MMVELNYLIEKLPNVDVKDTILLDQVFPWSGSLPSDCHVG